MAPHRGHFYWEQLPPIIAFPWERQRAGLVDGALKVISRSALLQDDTVPIGKINPDIAS